jgi:hypothetical protein
MKNNLDNLEMAYIQISNIYNICIEYFCITFSETSRANRMQVIRYSFYQLCLNLSVKGFECGRSIVES